ncbi:MAG: hypothetical protein SGI77_15580 [Pirellulaceae bacterium]|nr:hypothetical protein [Pirellulaceae bacterium]
MQSANSTYRRIGLLGVLALVCLRLTVGWHFYMEGVTKVREGSFSSVGFLGAAKGPLAPEFQKMVPDYDGRIRLDRNAMVTAYSSYVDRVRNTYSFNPNQTKDAEQIKADTIARWDAIDAEWSPQINEYFKGFERIAELAVDPKRSDVASLRAQRDEIESKWRGLVKPTLSAIDKNNANLESRLIAIATPNQRSTVGAVSFEIGGGLLSVRLIDKIIPIFDMSVGILLILGLLTPVAGVAAGLFLGSVVLSQFPGSPGALPTYFQAVEMVACFVLAFSDSGRYAGLDFFPWAFWKNRAAK